METNELMISGACLVIGVIFFIVAGSYMGHEANRAGQEYSSKDAERLASLIERISGEPFDAQVAMNLSLCDIYVKDGVLTLAEGGKNSSAFIPKSVQNAELKETASICIIKESELMRIAESCP